ncbi:hypothetical protein N9164_04290 [Draconibacterium sp.]|nr:hypothetical protein [Draconibacterium sp.]
MSSECSHKNPLVRDGVSQTARLLKALNPSYAKIDERSLLDLLTFIKKYAGELAYYNLKNKQDGTWNAFFQKNCVSFLADIANFDPQKAHTAYKDSASKILLGTQVKKNLKDQFDLLFTIIFEAEKWLRNIDKSLKLYNEILKEISASLSLELLNVISYYKKAVDINLINEADFNLNYQYPTFSAISILENNSFNEAWFRYKDTSTGLEYITWGDYYNSIGKSDTYNPTASTLKEKGKYSQYFLQKSLDKILSTYARLFGNIDVFLKDMLTNYPAHNPQMGLLLSFLQLFKYAQNQINTLTKRHLDFYLEDVLGLKKQNAVADKAHIVFELAKGIDQYKVSKNTALSAGKDTTGKEVLFFTKGETVFNKASVKELRNIYIDKDNNYRVYASPVANSPDGKGSEFTEKPGKWRPFGESQKNLTTRSMPNASLGFLVASETFEMSEGNRTIILDIHCEFNPDDIDISLKIPAFKAYISGKEGWIEKLNLENRLSPSGSQDKSFILFSKDHIQFNIKVKEDEDPIVTLDPKLHDSRFDIKSPAIFLECSQSTDNFTYVFLKDIIIEKIDITVSSDKTKTLLLQNDQTVIDPSKPFHPFGTIPKISSSFIVGSKEVFNKKLIRLTWNGKWNSLPNEAFADHYSHYNASIDNESFKVITKRLEAGEWKNIVEGVEEEKNLFNQYTESKFELVIHDNVNTPIKKVNVKTLPARYDINSKSGFIKLELADNSGFAFGHQVFPKIYAETAVKQTLALSTTPKDSSGNYTVGPPTFDFPNEPYTPSLKDFYIDYTAVATIKLDSSNNVNDGKFCQVHPFGYKELSKSTDSGDLYLLPQFHHEDEISEIDHNGELLIGFENITPPASLNLLFKVAEGSEDPDLPSQNIDWFYLKDDEWTAFESNEILADNTKNLTSTGILSISIPRFTSLKSTTQGKELLWIMAAVSNNTNASCQIIEIHPQAALSEFKDNKNDPLRTSVALKAKSISKLKIKDSSLKSINQPYASFGGKTEETSTGFYLRTAERMRHKDRGITIWDYERIILQEFPDLYKVKCVNHSTYSYNNLTEGEMNSEFAPGYVTLIVVPKTYNQNAINPYEPKVTKAQILEIEDFMKRRISPFAARKLKIINPLFEQIQLEFEVEFQRQFSDRGYYEKQLNEDIKKYLSPWAYSEGKDLVLGGRMHKSVIIDFIEELKYVDYLKDVKMHHYKEKKEYKKDINTAFPTEARSVFVTMNDADYTNEHSIKEIT